MYRAGMTPQQALDTFVDRFTPDVAAQAREVLAGLRKRLPGAVQLVYDNYNALAVGFAPVRKPSTAVISVAVYPRNVLLYFLRGAGLPDPHGLLQGSGSQGRHIPDADAASFRDKNISNLIDCAISHAEPPFDPKGTGDLVIQSVSARQRPRRPVGK